LSLSGQIDRLDRLADGSTMLIDYKTGRSGRSDWFPEARIVDPQLPAYAVAMDPPPFAITFARIRPEDLRFDGLAAGDTGTPGVAELAAEKRKYKGMDSWAELVADWQTRLTTLAEDFSSGRASVDPRKATVCNTCHLHALCRINERAPQHSLSDDDDE
jgi:RecB family exonuclease